MIGRLLGFCLVLAVLSAGITAQPSCDRAREMVAAVRERWSEANQRSDYEYILDKMLTATRLCFTDGEAWKYAYCSALALDNPRAEYFRSRALFNNMSEGDLACGHRAKVVIPTHVREKWALIIGISEFADPSIPQLRYAAKDAEDLADILNDPSYGRFNPGTVRLLTNADATREKILTNLDYLATQALEEDLVLLFISSHGSPQREGFGLSGVGYVVTYDTHKEKMYVNSIEYESLASKAASIRARRKTIFLDTCYSGQISAGSKSLSVEGFGVDAKTAKLFVSGEGTYVVTSSSRDEKSWESDELQNGYFTHFLIDALKMNSKEGPPTIGEVFTYLSSRVPPRVAVDKKAPQHPQLSPADGKGDVRIGVMPLVVAKRE